MGKSLIGFAGLRMMGTFVKGKGYYINQAVQDPTSENWFVSRHGQKTADTDTPNMADLPAEVAKAVDTLSVGDISKPFTMINERGKTVCAIARLKSRTEGHKATITEDFQVLKNLVLAKRRNQVLHDWVVKRIKSTYVRINERYRDCDFEYEGWVR